LMGFLLIIALLVVGVVLVVLAIGRHKTNETFVNTETGEKVPGPGFLSDFFGMFLYKGNLWINFNAKQKIYGDVWRTWMMGRPVLNIADADLARKVLKDTKTFVKQVQDVEKIPLLLKFFGKTSLASTNHPHWGI